MARTAAEKRKYHREYDRYYRLGHKRRALEPRITVPDGIETRSVHTPCFQCESRGPCRHRPWVGAVV